MGKPVDPGYSVEQELSEIQASLKNPREFEKIYSRHFSTIYIYIKSATGDKNLAADLCSDVFYSALINLAKYSPSEFGIRPWLFGIALNRLRMFFRQSGRMMYVPIDDLKLQQLTEEDLSFEKKERRKQLSAYLSLLTEEEQEFVQLRFVAECSFREIALVKGISEEACKMRLYRLLERMRKSMDKDSLL
jgi:RNA polymerase sigma-70 factor (ECF subfamily)